MRKGDVVFTSDAAVGMHALIATAQFVGSHFREGHSDTIHAAIATGQGYEVIESVGSGLKRRPLGDGRYRIFCYRGPHQNEIRDLAVLMAKSFQEQGASQANFGGYNQRKAARSPFRLRGGHNSPNAHTYQFGEQAKAHTRFFCSNLIWRCYVAAAEATGLSFLPIENSHSQLSPRELERLLIKSPHWHARNHGHSMQHP